MTTTSTITTAAPDAERVNYDARSGDVILLAQDGGEPKPHTVVATYPNQVRLAYNDPREDDMQYVRARYTTLWDAGATYLWKTPLAAVPDGLNLGLSGELAVYAASAG